MPSLRSQCCLMIVTFAFFFGVFGENTDLDQYKEGGRNWKFYDYLGGIISEFSVNAIFLGQSIVILSFLYSLYILFVSLGRSESLKQELKYPALLAIIVIFIWPHFVGATNTLRQLFYLAVLFSSVSFLIQGKAFISLLTLFISAFSHKVGLLMFPFFLLLFIFCIFVQRPFSRFLPIICLAFSFVFTYIASVLLVEFVSDTVPTGLDLRLFLIFLNALTVVHVLTYQKLDRGLLILYSVSLTFFGVSLNFYSESLIFERLLWPSVLPSLLAASLMIRRVCRVPVFTLILVTAGCVTLFVHLPQNYEF